MTGAGRDFRNGAFGSAQRYLAWAALSLVLLWPLFYLAAGVTGHWPLVIGKDILAYSVLGGAVLLFIAGKSAPPGVLILLSLYTYIAVVSWLLQDDYLFWLLGIREVVVNPLAFAILGYVVAYRWPRLAVRIFAVSAFVGALITFIHIVVGGELQNLGSIRFKGFWADQFGSGIVGGILVIAVLATWGSWEARTLRWVGLAVGVVLVVGSASRSVYLGLFAAMMVGALMAGGRFSRISRPMILLGVVCLGVLAFLAFDSISPRAIDHNLGARTGQWELGQRLLSDQPLLGIGIDKYNAVGGWRRYLEVDGARITTMDSTLFKYTLNLGVPLLASYLLALFLIWVRAVRTLRGVPEARRYISMILAFSVPMAVVTGQVAAFPLAMFFYSAIGMALAAGRIRHAVLLSRDFSR